MKEKEASLESLRPIPQVDKVLRHPLLQAQLKDLRHEVLAELVRQELSRLRSESTANGVAVPDLDTIAGTVVAKADNLLRGGMKRVINGTGVILNTNLGRAPVPASDVEQLINVLSGYSSLEIDLPTGKRGERTELIESLLRLLTGCEAAVVVNNNAAAVMLAVCALASGKEVVVSRGELIEIGGSFRLPDVITSSGGILKEVGTTNRTRASDYEKAVTDKTAMLLRCHRSNYQIVGFTEQPTMEEMVAVSGKTGVPLIEDLGSGAIIDLSRFGLKHEPTVPDTLKAGCHLVLFSGDKLLGGVQSGIVVGKKALVERLRKHPIYRALRADKMIIAMLEAVLAHYLTANPEESIPALRMAGESADSLRQRAEALKTRLNQTLLKLNCEVVSTTSTLGGGTLPGETLPSFGIHIKGESSPDKLARQLRTADLPIVPIVIADKLVIDLRTVPISEESLLCNSLIEIDKLLPS